MSKNSISMENQTQKQSDAFSKVNKLNGVLKWVFVAIVILVIAFFGFSVSVKEGSASIISSFGKVRVVYNDAGLHFKWPAPFEKAITYDTRSQYLDSGYVETLTLDKKNVILQTYSIWKIDDVEKFHKTVGSMTIAEEYINELVSNEKNAVMGTYNFSALVSTSVNELQIEEISTAMQTRVAEKALDRYGISITSLKIKRLALPDDNVQSVLTQMIADRQQYAAQLIAEGNSQAQIIRDAADAQAAAIVKEGNDSAVLIDIETARQVAAMEAEAFGQNSELYKFLKTLIALEESVDESTVFIFTAGDDPLEVLAGIDVSGGSGSSGGSGGSGGTEGGTESGS